MKKINPTEKTPISEALKKKGITKLTDNIPEGKELTVPPGLVMMFFGDLLVERFSTDSTSTDKKEKEKEKK